MWWYSSNSPVSPFIMEPAHSRNTFNGNFLYASFLGVSGDVVVAIHANINSCVHFFVVHPLSRVLFSGGSSSSWII